MLITGVNWCELLGVISLSLGDGSVKNYLVEIEERRIDPDDDEDDYGEEIS